MATLNEWGDDPNLDEGLGDVIYDEIEDAAKDGAKDAAEYGGKMAGKALDKVTDKIKPIKAVKDKVTGIKSAISRARQKVKDAAKKLAKEGIKAVGHMAVEGAKALGSFLASNPIVAIILIVVIIIIYSVINSDTESENVDHLQDDSILLESPVYVNLDGMSDDDVVVILMGDCVDQQYDTMNEMVDVEKEEKAKALYSVFHAYGFNNVSIAGMLGNIDIESGLDSSAIEGIFSEYGILGTKKAAALLSLGNYTEHTLFPLYKKSGISINRNGYKTVNSDGDTIYYCGLGLVQWTGENAKTLLTAAENISMDWYNLDFQLGYMMSDCMYRPGFFTNWVNNQEDDYDFDESAYNIADYASRDEYEQAIEDGKREALEKAIEGVKESAVHFAHDYEGNTGNDTDRKNAAVIWYGIIFEWGDSDVDSEYVDSIGSLAADLGAILDFLEIEEAQYRCLNGNIFDNSSLAAAAVSIAWPTNEQSYNNGTNLYQSVHDSIFPKDYVYKACDRAVASAVRWSGSDDTYPLGTAEQLRYLTTSSKWEKVGMASELSIDDLSPGDIFVLNGHTFMYVGESAVQSAYLNEAKAGSDSVSASLGQRSPACNASATSIMNRNGQDWEGRGVYHVFRCSDPDNSNTYTNAGTGATD